MKKLIVTLICFVFGITTYAQTPEEMKAWQDYMTPTESHKWLASLDGDWDASIKMWMDPSQPPSESKGTVTNKMIMDGRYQMSKHTGDFNGMPFKGQSLTAYDNAKKKYLATWIDNMGTGIMIMEGTFDDKTKTLTMHGEMVDPMTGKDMQVKEIITYTSDDTHKFEMFIIMGEHEMKSMEIMYSRRK